MDIFKQKRNFVITIIVLVIINLITLTLLWLGKPKHDLPNRPKFGSGEKGNVQNLLKKELDFTDEQAEQYITLQKEHREKMSEFNNELMEAKRNIFDYVLLKETDNSVLDSLVNVSLKKQTQLEYETIMHFQELKSLCKPEQVNKLKEVMQQILPPPERGPEGPPPGGPPPGDRDPQGPRPDGPPPPGEKPTRK